MHNWNQIYSKGNLNYLHKKGQGKPIKLAEAYDALMDDYIRVFGLNKKARQLNKLKVQLIKRNLKFIESNSLVQWNKIKKLREEIEVLENEYFSQNSEEFNKNHVILQKWYGQRIDLKEITVLEYQSIVKVYEQENRPRRNSRKRSTR